MTNGPWQHRRASGVSDDIDFDIRGEDLQFVEIELDPGESAVAEAGAMVWKDATIGMTTVFGDGSAADQEGGFMGKLLGAGKRLVTGESLFTTVFTHHGQGKARVAFAAPTPGTILPLKLDEVGGTLICQKDAFLAAFGRRWLGLRTDGRHADRARAWPGRRGPRRYRLRRRLHLQRLDGC